MPEQARSAECPSEPQANGLTALYVPKHLPKRLVWAHNLMQQVIHAAARLSIGSSNAETVNKRVAQHGFIVYLEQSNGPTSPNLARVRFANNA